MPEHGVTTRRDFLVGTVLFQALRPVVTRERSLGTYELAQFTPR